MGNLRIQEQKAWDGAPLGDLAENESRPFNFKDKDKVIFVNTGDVLEGKFLHAEYSDIAGLPGQAKKAISKHDILYSEIRPGNCRFAYVSDDSPDHVVSTKFMVIRAKPGVDSKFLYFVLTSKSVRNEFQRIAESRSGTFPQITFDSISHFPIPFPPKSEQVKIVNFLNPIYEKIESNLKINEVLRSMADALFKDWFVSFGPVRTKIEGKSASSFYKKWLDLFPDQFDDDKKPKGWTVKKLADLTTKIGSGSTPRGGKEVYVEEGMNLIRSQNVYDHRFAWDGLAKISDDDAQKLRNVAVESNDILINITGDSILRTCVADPSIVPARVNQHVSIIRAASNVPTRYLHLHLVQPTTKYQLLGNDAGGSRAAITKGHLEALPILLPSERVLKAFETLTEPWFALIYENEKENHTLASLAELLLPRLVSGEILFKGRTRDNAL